MVGLVRGAQVSVRRRGLASRRAQRSRARVQDARPNGPQQKLPLVRGPNVPGAGLVIGAWATIVAKGKPQAGCASARPPAQTKVRGILSPQYVD